MIFETERLLVRVLDKGDRDAFFDMMGNPKVMNLIPRPVMTREESDDFLNKLMFSKAFDIDKQVSAIVEKKSSNFIGLCAFLKNDEQDDEIGYRLREQFWRQGYGTEITKGLIQYGFEVMKTPKITADVHIENIGSIKILEKFFQPVNEFFNEDDNCIDRRYELLKKEWKVNA